MSWVRPLSVPFPTVWRRFTGINNKVGKTVKFKIQDVPESLEDEVVHIMSTHFLRDEQLFASQKILEDPVSVQEFQTLWRKSLEQKMVLVALVDEDDDRDSKPRIAGANFTGVSHKSGGLQLDALQGRALKTVLKFVYEHALTSIDVYKIYGVDCYLSALGLVVLPEYRGYGLSSEILKARFPLARAVGLKATMTMFSPLESQMAAESAGFKCLGESMYEDYKIDGKVVFPNMNSRSLTVMGREIEGTSD